MNCKKKRMQYSKENLQKALILIKSGASVRSVSQQFNIPRATLTAKRDNKYADKKPGPKTILTEEEEKVLENWILDRGSVAVPITKEQLLNSVQLIVKDRVNPFTNNRPGKQWYRAFMQRHSNLSERVSENLSSSRAIVNEADLRAWFSEINNYLISHSLKDIDASRIFNADETACLLNPKSSTVIVKKGSKIVYNAVDNNEKEGITTLITGNAAGQLAPPLVLFAYQRIPGYIVNRLPKGWGVGGSDNGWMTDENFYEFIANIFHPWLHEKGIQLPVVLFVDGHSSHLTQPLSIFCMQHQIILIALHPNSTHILQPMDVSLFRPFKMEYKKVVESYRIEHNQVSVQKEDFAPLIKKVLDNLDLKRILENGFKKCGLHPFNADAIDYNKLLLTKRSHPEANQVENVSSEHLEAVKRIEKVINSETLNVFKMHECSECTGSDEDKSLFEVWWKLTHPSENNNHEKHSDGLQSIYEVIDTVKNVEVNEEPCEVPLSLTLMFDEYGKLLSHENVPEDFIGSIQSTRKDLINPPNRTFEIVSESVAPANELTIMHLDSKSTASHSKNIDSTVTTMASFSMDCINSLECSNSVSATLLQLVQPTNTPDNLCSINSAASSHSDHLKSNIEVDCTLVPETHTFDAKNSGTEINHPLQNITNLNSLQNGKEINSRVPSPFKKFLYWPKEKVSKKKVRIAKEKLPSIITTDLWLNYNNEKEGKKKKFEEEKENRKRIRLAKAEIKKEKVEIEKKKKQLKEKCKTMKNENSSVKENVLPTFNKRKTQVKKNEPKPRRVRKVTIKK